MDGTVFVWDIVVDETMVSDNVEDLLLCYFNIFCKQPTLNSLAIESQDFYLVIHHIRLITLKLFRIHLIFGL